MSDILWSAYSAEADFLTTQMDSLADGAESALGSIELDNTSALKTLMDLNIVLASLNPTTGAFIVIRLLTSIDGTNYPDGNASPIYTAEVATGSGAKRIEMRQIILSPGKHKLKLTNETNVVLAATGNTVKYRTYSTTFS